MSRQILLIQDTKNYIVDVDKVSRYSSYIADLTSRYSREELITSIEQSIENFIAFISNLSIIEDVSADEFLVGQYFESYDYFLYLIKKVIDGKYHHLNKIDPFATELQWEIYFNLSLLMIPDSSIRPSFVVSYKKKKENSLLPGFGELIRIMT